MLEDHPEFKERMKIQCRKDMKDLTWDNLVDDLFDEMDLIVTENINRLNETPYDQKDVNKAEIRIDPFNWDELALVRATA